MQTLRFAQGDTSTNHEPPRPMRHRLPLLAAIATLGTTPLDAQTANKPTLTLDGARRVIAAAESYARANRTTGVIAVVDDGGNLMALERIDATFAAGASISIGKARTAAMVRSERPTNT